MRIGREVSHPNVCRLYDVVEVDGRHFLAMEYVDGEDLASLLSRIGRLPPDKALELARDLCAGLAAVHDKGVVHRDLKPANVMIDGRGRARITDFGLAASQATAQSEAFAGTPAYMSPEQLAGGEATQRSDLYALGLVLLRDVHRPAASSTRRTLEELLRAAPRGEGCRASRRCRASDARRARRSCSASTEDPLARPALGARGRRAAAGRRPAGRGGRGGRDAFARDGRGRGPRRGPERPAAAWAALAGERSAALALCA